MTNTRPVPLFDGSNGPAVGRGGPSGSDFRASGYGASPDVPAVVYADGKPAFVIESETGDGRVVQANTPYE